MPLYEFQCPKCNLTFDIVIHYRAENPFCSKCGVRMNRKIGGANLQIKVDNVPPSLRKKSFGTAPFTRK